MYGFPRDCGATGRLNGDHIYNKAHYQFSVRKLESSAAPANLFIKSYNEDNSQGLIQIQTDQESSHVGNWTIRVISKVNPDDNGQPSQWKYSTTTEVEINSYCVAARFSVPTNDSTVEDYYIWDAQASIQFS